MIRRPPSSPLFPYTTLSRSQEGGVQVGARHAGGRQRSRKDRHADESVDPPAACLVHQKTPWFAAGSGPLHGRIFHRQSNTIQKNCYAHKTTTEERAAMRRDRKSTRLNSSHLVISYAVFCLKKKNSSKTELRCADGLTD